MTFKDLAVFVDSGRANDARMALAVALARRFEAHLAAIHIIPIPATKSPDGLTRSAATSPDGKWGSASGSAGTADMISAAINAGAAILRCA